MKNMMILFAVTVLTCALAHPQSVIHPWHVVDQGGGKSTAGGLTLQSSIGQGAVQAMSATGTNLESGYIPGLRNFSGASSTLTVLASDGWNMVSVPAIVSDFRKPVLYPTATSSAFSYKGGYVVEDTLEYAIGYWLKFSGATSVSITGTTLQQESVAVASGWNMIGPPSYPVPLSLITPVGTAVSSNYFAYSSGSGYVVEDTLQPGAGYWVKVNHAGTLFMQTGSVIIAPRTSLLSRGKNLQHPTLYGVKDMSGIGTLTMRDAGGSERTLFFSPTRTDLDPAKYEMPPLPPEGTMDARFGTNRLLEVADKSESRSVPVRVTSAKYPITISWEGLVDGTAPALVVDGKETAMKGTSEIRLANPASHIAVKFLPASSVAIPKAFALYQNYPNPFNPSTTIRYDLPKDAHVTIRIYDALGEEVKTVRDDVEGAGYRSVVWNSVNNEGNSIASGVYFYRIEATPVSGKGTPFAEVKKMMVMK